MCRRTGSAIIILKIKYSKQFMYIGDTNQSYRDMLQQKQPPAS